MEQERYIFPAGPCSRGEECKVPSLQAKVCLNPSCTRGGLNAKYPEKLASIHHMCNTEREDWKAAEDKGVDHKVTEYCAGCYSEALLVRNLVISGMRLVITTLLVKVLNNLFFSLCVCRWPTREQRMRWIPRAR